MVTLVNRTDPPRPLVLNLTAVVAPVRMELDRRVEAKGVVSVQKRRLVVPDSITVPARGELEVDDSVLSCPDVQSAVRKNLVAVINKTRK